MREAGLEPAHPKAPEPKSGASANSATRARRQLYGVIGPALCGVGSTTGAHAIRSKDSRRTGHNARVHRLVFTAFVALAAAALHLARLPAVARGTMYAEDGFVFIEDSVTGNGWWGAPYAGYLHVLPRMVATVVTAVLPVSAWAWGMAVGAAGLVGLVAATAFVVSRHVHGGWLLPLAAAAFPVLVPIAGVEGIANVGNFHSFAVYGAFFTILAAPSRWAAQALMGLLAFLFAVSEAQVLLLVPAAVILLVDRGRRRLPAAVGLFAGVACQVVVGLAGEARERASDPPGPLALARGWLFDGFLGAFVARTGPARLIVDVGTWWLLAAAFLAWCVVAVLALRRTRQILLGCAVLAASIGSWVMANYFNDYSSTDFVTGPWKMIRWGTVPALMVLAIVVLAAGALLTRGRPIAWGTRVGVLLVMALQTASFVLPTSRSGVYWEPEVDRARTQCAQGVGQATIPILPGDAVVRLPCTALR